MVKKKPIKKTIAKKPRKKAQAKKQELAIVSDEALAPEQEGTKFALQNTFIKEKQILKMLQRTPKQHIYTRPAKGGGVWEYVTGTYMKKILNFVFGWNWDFEVIDEQEKHGQVIVKGRLTVKDGKGNSIVKMQFGRAEIKTKKGSTTPMDYGNDLKSATTDALKKCASEFGIASDIYGKNEFKDVGKQVAVDKEEGVTFESAKELIAKETDDGVLVAFLEQAKASKKYTATQKKELDKLVSSRVDELLAKE